MIAARLNGRVEYFRRHCGEISRVIVDFLGDQMHFAEMGFAEARWYAFTPSSAEIEFAKELQASGRREDHAVFDADAAELVCQASLNPLRAAA